MPMIRVSKELKGKLEKLKERTSKRSLDELIDYHIFGDRKTKGMGLEFNKKVVPPVETIESIYDIPMIRKFPNCFFKLEEYDTVYVALDFVELETINKYWLTAVIDKAIRTLNQKSKEYSKSSPIFVFRDEIENRLFFCSLFPKDSKIKKT